MYLSQGVGYFYLVVDFVPSFAVVENVDDFVAVVAFADHDLSFAVDSYTVVVAAAVEIADAAAAAAAAAVVEIANFSVGFST